MLASLFGPRSATEPTANDEFYVTRRSSEPASAGHVSGQTDSGNGQRTRSSLDSVTGTTKRYGIYEFNWPGANAEDDNKGALDTNSNFDTTTTIAPGVKTANFDSWDYQEKPPSSPVIKPLSIKSTISDPLDPPRPSLGGIQVTQVSVVEIHERTDGSVVNSVEPTNLPHRGDYNNWEEETDWQPPVSRRRNYKHRHSYSDSIMNASFSKNFNKLINGFKSTQDRTSKRTHQLNFRISTRRNEEDQARPLPTFDESRRLRPKRRTSVMTQGKPKRKSVAVNAIQPLTKVWNPSGEFQPTTANGRHMVRQLPPSGRRLRRNGATIYRKQTQTLSDGERAPTSNPAFANDPTDIEDDSVPTYTLRTPWVPKPIRPPQLLHATLVPLPRRLSRSNSRTSKVAGANLSRRTRLNPRRQSKLVPSPSASVTASIADARGTQGIRRMASTRVRRRKRTSVISNDTKRSSVIMRQGLLEDSIMMSIMGGALGAGLKNGLLHNMNHKQEKPLIRKRTKKGKENNAMTRGVEELDEKSRKNEFLTAPPRKVGQDNFSPDFTPDQSPNSSFSSSASEKRSMKSNIEPSPSPPPFPTHLARSTRYGNDQLSPKLIQPKSSESYAYSRPQRIITDVKKFSTDRFKDPETTQELDDVPALTSMSTPTSPTQYMPNRRKSKPIPSPITPRPTNPLSPGVYESTRSPPPPPTPIIVPPTKLPQSPPLSPIKTLPATVLGRSRQKNEPNMNASISPEKLLKMQKFEALLAASDVAGDKKQRTKKKRADQSSVTSPASPEMPLSPLSPMSATPPTRNPNFGRMVPEMRKKVASVGIPPSLIPGAIPQLPVMPPLHVDGGDSLRRSLGKDSTSDRQSMNSMADSVTGSVAGSVADSVAESFTIHYRPEEKVELATAQVGEDGVLRLTLTPAVCR
ncbi:9045_t:CDS:2 [Paraglomus occultum]|uniref:9045_t:CDS:1 n=1 Tax=Paraglomus occultum TaxID=144539 RepID=A0A9N9AFM2_9GLOM|nr:9045_t:CDS:2 [Paraglomus occultum]